MRRWIPAIAAALLLTLGALAQIGGGGISGGGGGGGAVTGNFTLTWDVGCSANNTQTYNYAIIASQQVLLNATQSVFCTSSAVTMSASAGALPTAIRPAHSVTVLVPRVQDNGGGLTQPGCIQFNTDGSVVLNTNTVGSTVMCQTTAGWTAASTKGFASAYGNFAYGLL